MSLTTMTEREQKMLLTVIQHCLQNSEGLKVNYPELQSRLGFSSLDVTRGTWNSFRRKYLDAKDGNANNAVDGVPAVPLTPNATPKATPKKRARKADGENGTPSKRGRKAKSAGVNAEKEGVEIKQEAGDEGKGVVDGEDKGSGEGGGEVGDYDAWSRKFMMKQD